MCFKEATRNMVILCMCECECLCSNAENEPCSQTSRALSRGKHVARSYCP
jgi:hypothetical protein